VTTTVLAYIPSPSQGVWHLGVIPLRAYALFIIMGIVVALLLGDRRWEARGGERGVIYDIAIPAVLFGLIGGRLYHVMTDWRTYFGDDGAGLAGALRIWDGGLGIWGAVALGGVGAWIGCRQKGIPLPAFGDAIAPGIVLAQAIGRLGNYFNQELYGRPTTLPWGLEIFERRDVNGALDSLNGVSTGQLVEVVHPTFLYELLWNVLVFAALIWLDRRFKIGHGRLFAMYVAGYCLGRFWIELMRSDHATTIADTGIRINSFTSTFVFIGAVVYIMVAPKGREDPASLAGKQETEGEEEDTVEAFAKELTAVAATTGVVAAAKAAGEAEDEDTKAAVEDGEEPEAEAEDEAAAEVAIEAEDLAPDVLGVPAEAEPEPEAEESEAEAEAEEPEAESDEEPEAKADAVADEVATEDEAAGDEDPEAEGEADESSDAETPEPEAGLGVVEGEEAVEAQEAAAEVHEAALEAADEAEAVAEAVAAEDEADAEAEDAAEDDSEPDEPETEDAEAAVKADEAEPSEEEAAEEAEAVVDEADSAADEEPTTGVLEAEAEPEAKSEPAAPAEGRSGPLRRWLRRSR
jgi:prolipoprotein diacylglyceryl transferase